MEQVKQDEFLAILDTVASIPRPQKDYSTLHAANFAECQFIRRLMEIQAFFMAFFKVTGKVPVNKEGMKDILVKSMNLTPLSLAAIYHATSDGPLVSLLANLIIEELFIGQELERRLVDKRWGTVLNLAPFFCDTPLPSFEWIAKGLKVDKIKSFRPHKQDDDEIRTDSVLRAIELAKNLESPAYDPGPLPSFPLELRPVEASFWNVGLGRVWREGHETLRKGLIPVLEGEAERIPGQARDDWREEWKKIARHERILEIHHNEIAEELHSERFREPESSVSSLAGKRAYQKIVDKHGEKARIFLEALPESGWKNKINITEASNVAKISRVTAHKWLDEYKRTYGLEIKKPTKPRKK